MKFSTVLTLWVLIFSSHLKAKSFIEIDKSLHSRSGGDVIFSNGFEELTLGEDPGIIFQDAKIGFISNSYMGAWGGLNNYLELSVNASTEPVDLNTVPAREGFGGWFWGLGLSDMTSALDRIESEGDYDSCVFLDSFSLDTMRTFADRLFAACTHVVLFADAGGHNPVTLSGNYFNATENTLDNARIMQSEYPDLIVVPAALIFFDLVANPPVSVPRLDYLHGSNNIHQNGLGTLVNAFTMFAVLTAKSPVGIEFTYDLPATPDFKFMDGENILIGYQDPHDTPEDLIVFDDSVRNLFQQRILQLLVEWNASNTVFDD